MYHVYILYRLFPKEFWVSVILTLILLCGGIFMIIMLYKKNRLSRRTRNLSLLWWIYLLFLLYFTVIGRYRSEYYKVIPEPFESYRLLFSGGGFPAFSQIFLNILLFVPFGVLTAELIHKRLPVWTTVIAGMILSALVEVIQLVCRVGTFETDDLIHNTLGTALGILLWYGIRAIIKKRKENKNAKNEELS